MWKPTLGCDPPSRLFLCHLRRGIFTLTKTMERPSHLNSLGYVIAGSATERVSTQAMIAWGERSNGELVHIQDAAAGLADELKCACGASLVARKGSIRVHHFAHKAGTIKGCEQARLKALSLFARKSLEGVGVLNLPPNRGERLSAKIDEIRDEIFGQCAGVWMTTVKGEKRSEIAVLFVVKRGQQLPDKAHFKGLQKSAMVVDLTDYRNQPDPKIAKAIVMADDCDWIYNARYPNLKASSSPQVKSDRRHHALLAQLVAGTSRTATQTGITEEEWQTLHYTELRRRVFGWTEKK